MLGTSKAVALEKDLKSRYRQPLIVSKVNPFLYQERKHPIRDLKLRVLNTVFAYVDVERIPVSALNEGCYCKESKPYSVMKRRRLFGEGMLYPSIKESGILDPLILQYLTNVGEDLGGFIALIGNCRLNVLQQHKELNITKVPSFVINIVGDGREIIEPPMKGELINSEEVALSYYKGRSEVRFHWNEEGYLVDVSMRRFRPECLNKF